jgi:hypothetical protein
LKPLIETLKPLPELIRAEAGRRSLLIVACLAGAIFLGSWSAIHHFYPNHRIIDTPTYQRYGDWVLDGYMPYKSFDLEYPPGALPAFVLPAIDNSPKLSAANAYLVRTAYVRNFEFLMAVCGLASIALAAVVLRWLRASIAHASVALGLIALSPLMLGPVMLSRFDLWPTMLAIGALAAIVARREWAGFGALGLGTATKIYPAVLLPLACVWVWKRSGWRVLGACLGVFIGMLAACFVPYLIFSPGGVWHSLSVQLGRPLQIESLGSAVLVNLHNLAGYAVTVVNGSGSQNLTGSGTTVIADIQTVLQALALVGVWVWFGLGEASGERMVRASAAAIVAFVAFGKVLSPQYMIWLLPFVPLVRGRRGAAASALLAVSLVLTQVWFPYRYWDYVDFKAFPSALVLLRDAALIGLFGTLLLRTRARREEVPGLVPAAAVPIPPGA